MSKSTSTKEVSNHIHTTLNKVPAMLRLFFKRRLSVFLLSDPGIGKTSVVNQVGKAMNAHVITLVASVRDRLDMGGLPFVERDAQGNPTARFAPMEMMASLSKERNPDGPETILYLNEAPHAPDSLQPVLYRLVNERAVEGLTLRDNVHIVADGNPESCIGAGRSLQLPLRRRFMWLCIETSLSAWTGWANRSGLDARVISFLNNPGFEQHFCDFNPRERHRITYSTPASWHNLANTLEDILTTFGGEDDKDSRTVMFSGIVGSEAGTAFSAYIDHLGKIPDPIAVLEDPENAPLPNDPGMLSLLIGGVVNAVSKNIKLVPAALDLCIRFVDSRNKTGYPEFGTFLGRSLAARSPEIFKAIKKSSKASKLATMLMEQEQEYFEGIVATSK